MDVPLYILLQTVVSGKYKKKHSSTPNSRKGVLVSDSSVSHTGHIGHIALRPHKHKLTHLSLRYFYEDLHVSTYS
jgi:hypothetical protein